MWDQPPNGPDQLEVSSLGDLYKVSMEARDPWTGFPNFNLLDALTLYCGLQNGNGSQSL